MISAAEFEIRKSAIWRDICRPGEAEAYDEEGSTTYAVLRFGALAVFEEDLCGEGLSRIFSTSEEPAGRISSQRVPKAVTAILTTRRRHLDRVRAAHRELPAACSCPVR